MKFLKQFLVIIAVTCAGELLNLFLDLPVPGSIYGMVLMLVLLNLGIIKLEQVKDAGEFLIEIMPVMFIPAAAGLIDSWAQIKSMLPAICVTIPLSACMVIFAAGKVTDFMIDHRGNKKDSSGSDADRDGAKV